MRERYTVWKYNFAVMCGCEFRSLIPTGSPAGNLTDAAQRALGHKVVIKRFMVTVWGRTGYLQPDLEYAPLIGTGIDKHHCILKFQVSVYVAVSDAACVLQIAPQS